MDRREAINILTGPRIRDNQKKIGNNTWLVWCDNNPAIKLHATKIVVFEEHGLRLYSGGWQTVTTKQRMNKYLRQFGYHLSQEKHVWYIYCNGVKMPYVEGMVLAYQ